MIHILHQPSSEFIRPPQPVVPIDSVEQKLNELLERVAVVTPATTSEMSRRIRATFERNATAVCDDGSAQSISN